MQRTLKQILKHNIKKELSSLRNAEKHNKPDDLKNKIIHRLGKKIEKYKKRYGEIT